MRKVKSISFMISVLMITSLALILAVPLASADEIAAIDVAPDDNTAGATTDYNITFTPATGEATSVVIDFSAFGTTANDMVLTGVSTVIESYSFTGFASSPTGVTVDDSLKTITFTGGTTTAGEVHTITNATPGTGLRITNDRDAETQDVEIRTASDSGTYALTIDPDTINKIVFTTDPQTITAGVASEVMTIQTQDQYGNPSDVTEDTTINLTSTSETGRFDTSPTGPFDETITSVTITADGNSASFYYKDNAAGTYTITVADSWTADQGVTVEFADLSAAAENYVVAAVTTYTAGFTTGVEIPVSGSIEIVFPAEYDLTTIHSDTDIAQTGYTGNPTFAVDGQIVKMTLDTENVLGAENLVTIAIDNVTNPPTAETYEITINTKDSGGTVIETSTVDMEIVPGTLTNVSATPADPTVDATTSYTVAFTTATTGTIATIDMEFAEGFDISGATLVAKENIGVGLGSIVKVNQVITYTVDTPGEVTAGTGISITMSGIKNPATAQTYSPGVTVTTKVATGENIDTGTADVTIELLHMVSAVYSDADSDAKVDQVVVTYSSDIDEGSTFDNENWSFPVNPHDLTAVSGTFSGADVTIVVSGAPENCTHLEPTTIKYTENVEENNIKANNGDAAAGTEELSLSDGAAPVIIEFEAQLGAKTATVKFSEGVYTNDNGTGALVIADFAYTDASGGDAGSTTSVSHIAGVDIAVVTLNAQATFTDISTPDTIAAAATVIYDLAGNAAGTDTEDMTDDREALSLVDGWNLVSVPKIPSAGWDIATNAPALIEIYTYENGSWELVTDADSLDAVFVKADGAQELALSWTTVPWTAPPVKDLEQGWNLIGTNMDSDVEISVRVDYVLDSVFGSYSTVFSPACNLSAWTVTTATASGQDMLTYEGYWVYMLESAELAGRTT
ncbi:hypothetical protein ES703_09222 [subsurface metagenome]